MRIIPTLLMAAVIAASPALAVDSETPKADAYFACIVGVGANAIRHGSDTYSALNIADQACEPLGKEADKEVGLKQSSLIMKSAFDLVDEIGKIPKS